MKKLLALAVVAGGLAIFGTAQTAEANHCYYGGRGYYGGSIYRGPVYGSSRSFYSPYRGSYYSPYRNFGRSGFTYYRPGFSISIGRGGFYGGGSRGFRSGGRHFHR